MDGQIGQAVMPRSQQLMQTWERFSQADKNLFHARESVEKADQECKVAYSHKSAAEQEWHDASQQLMNVMIADAPDAVRQQYAQEQARVAIEEKRRLDIPVPTMEQDFIGKTAAGAGNSGLLRRSY